MQQILPVTGKPLTYYVDSPPVRQLSRHFGSHLERLPQHHLWDIVLAIAAFFNNQTHPLIKENAKWEYGNIHRICESFDIDFDNADYSQYLEASLAEMSLDELRGLNCFLGNRLNP